MVLLLECNTKPVENSYYLHLQLVELARSENTEKTEKTENTENTEKTEKTLGRSRSPTDGSGHDHGQVTSMVMSRAFHP